MINEQIRDREVRLIGEDGEQVGVMSAKDAMKLAREAGLDLVKIAPNAKPPVCKIVDYGKYRYELARKEKEAKKKQKVTDVKEIRLSPNIDVNDLKPNLHGIVYCIQKRNIFDVLVIPSNNNVITEASLLTLKAFMYKEYLEYKRFYDQ